MESQEAVAVFLGPSLPRARAREILEADYLPPARMGDVHRLVASGVRLVVLIDGLFHGAPAIWHRELLEAMDHGLVVIGAASMGALRAAELHTLGMTGVGTIFEWYRDGVLDGDDEVALLHSDADDGYRLLSQPLVNTRHRLHTAVERGWLAPELAREAIEHVKRAAFMWRTHEYLLASEVVRRWPETARRGLKDVLDDPGLDLKARDAQRALEHASAWLARPDARPPRIERPAPSRYYRARSKQERGLRSAAGRLVSARVLWERARSDRALVRGCLAEAATRFYLGSLAEQWGVRCPTPFVEAFGERWDARFGVTERGPWLSANGLTMAERCELLEQLALVEWMVERGPAAFGLDPSPFSRLPRLWELGRAARDDDEAQAARLCLLAAWARTRGIRCPDAVVERVEQRLGGADAREAVGLDPEQWRTLVRELASSEWIVHQQPGHFGHPGWTAATAVLEQLQITGRAARLLDEMTS